MHTYTNKYTYNTYQIFIKPQTRSFLFRNTQFYLRNFSGANYLAMLSFVSFPVISFNVPVEYSCQCHCNQTTIHYRHDHHQKTQDVTGNTTGNTTTGNTCTSPTVEVKTNKQKLFHWIEPMCVGFSNSLGRTA